MFSLYRVQVDEMLASLSLSPSPSLSLSLAIVEDSIQFNLSFTEQR